MELSGNPFPSANEAYVFVIVILLWILSEAVGATIIPRMRRRGSKVARRNPRSNWLSFTLVYVDWVAVFGASMGFAGNGIALLPSWAYYAGIMLMLGGIALRQWAIAVLGRYFSGVIGVQEEQKVVDTGPYRLVRHPSYTGAFLIQLGIGLALGSLGAVLVIAVTFGLTYGYRMFVEEGVLISELSGRYTEYMKRTKRIIPFLI
jgi:protein-S-isoprenylcysteine O-methyltransferase Ste14